jgi:hypothetical protein
MIRFWNRSVVKIPFSREPGTKAEKTGAVFCGRRRQSLLEGEDRQGDESDIKEEGKKPPTRLSATRWRVLL